ncbi:MMPL family transporter [Paenibacillus sacheonensis]|uniref:MMPL family transporter n=1 Tax=Paenibacillus sacheonensis TaxID=742054 RepID=A0A7X5C3J9_9BACL|nr:MMPL family transporter [Paenibacillus sacheonensis]MBM7566812.1 RND superfamily putative drug exporter [Paenibacillus sacheonensis]NBC71434.1 MMPL family transporter [Paenibacillus sacheonensis]
MTERFIRGLARAKWLILLGWLAIAAISMLALPDLGSIVRQTEQKFIPTDSESVVAKSMLDRINPESTTKSSAILVYSRDGGLTDEDRTWLKAKAAELAGLSGKDGFKSVQSAYGTPELASKFRSQDGTTEMILVGFSGTDNDALTQDAVDSLNERIQGSPAGSKVELTGSAPIGKDFQQSSSDGLKKTELLTVGLVLVILLIVFRSPVAPFIPLITIGISLVITRGLVAAATYWGMPVSSFTESFLIAVMFGAGTDYCILLIQRFREELSRDGDKVEALVRTVRTVGKTVAFSASTVFVAFFLIGFAQFGLYQSAAGVSIGVAVTLIAGLTLTPALLMAFGQATFWPSKIASGQGHGDSKLWGSMAALAARRPVAILLVTVILLAPLTLLYHNKRSFDDLAEISPKLGSVQGFRQVERSFGSGEVFPLSVAITSDASMRTPEALAAMETASASLASLSGVKEVRSAVRPLGAQLADLTVSGQLTQTSQALQQLKDGVDKVAGGLRDAEASVAGGQGDVDKLASGLRTMASKTKEAQTGLNQIHGGLQQASKGAGQLAGGLSQSAAVSSSLRTDLDALLKSHPELKDEAAMKQLLGKLQALERSLKQLEGGADRLSASFSQLNPGVSKAAGGLGQLAAGQTDAAEGAAKLGGGLKELTSGLSAGAGGLGDVSKGLTQVKEATASIGDSQIPGWNLPQSALDSPELQQALDYYISADGKTAKLDVVLAVNPYSPEAQDTVGRIRDALRASLSGSSLANAKVYLSGTSAQITELKAISKSDFVRTGAFVLIGIFIVLLIMLRSILAPLYLLLSLGFNFLVTMGIVEFIFVKLLGKEGLSWSASFFIFLIIVALGVDYSIFLMARFKEEYRPGGITHAMTKAMSTTGGVIVSAAIIMGGTFAALMMSGVNTLLQIGAGIVIGLILYAFVFMGLVVPALANLFGEANWWPFRRVQKEATGRAANRDRSLQPADGTE